MATIRNPGKFEGEPSYVPALWDMVLEGATDDEFHDGETPVAVFTVDAALRAEFTDGATGTAYGIDPADVTALVDGESVLLWESETGFVNSRTVDAAELARIMGECAADAALGVNDDY